MALEDRVAHLTRCRQDIPPPPCLPPPNGWGPVAIEYLKPRPITHTQLHTNKKKKMRWK